MSRFNRPDPSDDPRTDAGRGTLKADRKYRCAVCDRLFDLPGMTLHHRETGHGFTLHGHAIDLGRDVFQGEFYPCKPDIFAATYDPVEAPRAQEAEVSA